jgi:RNA polymerase sigma-70 factor (ECF subfamily)
MDFHELYDRYAADVHRFALYLCGDPALADDLTSETFLRAWSSTSPIREATVKAYLFTIVRHLYLSELRRSSRHAPLTDAIASPAPGQDVRFEKGSALDTVLRGLRALPEIERAALLMRTQGGMSYAEIAETLQLSTVNAKVKVHRARLKLTALLPERILR